MEIGDLVGQIGFGLPLGLGALGSSLGVGAAGKAAAGAWAKEGREGKPLSFAYILLVGMPLSQTIYSFILMFIGLQRIAYDPAALAANAGAVFGIGVSCGLGEFASAWMQGVIGAAAIRCLSDSEGKGLAFLIIAMGIAETVGIFSWVFGWLLLPVAGAA